MKLKMKFHLDRRYLNKQFECKHTHTHTPYAYSVSFSCLKNNSLKNSREIYLILMVFFFSFKYFIIK